MEGLIDVLPGGSIRGAVEAGTEAAHRYDTHSWRAGSALCVRPHASVIASNRSRKGINVLCPPGTCAFLGAFLCADFRERAMGVAHRPVLLRRVSESCSQLLLLDPVQTDRIAPPGWDTLAACRNMAESRNPRNFRRIPGCWHSWHGSCVPDWMPAHEFRVAPIKGGKRCTANTQLISSDQLLY